VRHSLTISQIEAALADIGIFDTVSNRAVDLFKVSLLESFENTHLPELYDALGKDAFLKLLDVFENSTFFACPHCGQSLKFPTLDKIQAVLLDVAAYCRLLDAPKGTKSGIIRELARQYGTSLGRVRSSFNRMERRAQRYQISRSNQDNERK
jgi:hypothetical protein